MSSVNTTPKQNKSLEQMLAREAEFISQCNNHRKDYEVTCTQSIDWVNFVNLCFLADANTTRVCCRALILGGTYDEIIAYCTHYEKKVLKKKTVYTRSVGAVNASIKFLSDRGWHFDRGTAEDGKVWIQVVEK